MSRLETPAARAERRRNIRLVKGATKYDAVLSKPDDGHKRPWARFKGRHA